VDGQEKWITSGKDSYSQATIRAVSDFYEPFRVLRTNVVYA